MRILYSKLINLPVQTQSGQFLGNISDVEIDIDTYSLLKMYVKSSNLLRGLFEELLIVSQAQIIKITNESIVVDDNIKKRKIKKSLKINILPTKTEAIATTAQKQ